MILIKFLLFVLFVFIYMYNVLMALQDLWWIV